MYDTYVTVVGNVLTRPEYRTTKNTGALVAHFKVASTARRLDRETGKWVDGNSFRVRVNCWRKLAEGVGGSLITGDPVIVVGRLYTRDWKDENQNHRVGYELEAVAVGHDLSRGQSTFTRNRPALSTSAVDDGQEPIRVRGEETEPVPADRVLPRPDFADMPAPPDGYDPLAGIPGVFGPVEAEAEVRAGGEELAGADDDLAGADDALTVAPPDGGDDDDIDETPVAAEPGEDQAGGQEERSGRSRRRGRSPVPA
jgi:single-strand DNA-binding protein